MEPNDSGLNRVRYLPTSSWRTRSTGRPPRHKALSSKPCRSSTSPWRENSIGPRGPFLVLATQNPIEMEGTYPLPEAQLDRFLLKLNIEYPEPEDLHEILNRTTRETVRQGLDASPLENLDSLRELIRAVPVVREVEARAIQLVLATHPGRPQSVPLARKFVRYGASPRGAQALILCAKVGALLDGRYHVAKGRHRRLGAPRASAPPDHQLRGRSRRHYTRKGCLRSPCLAPLARHPEHAGSAKRFHRDATPSRRHRESATPGRRTTEDRAYESRVPWQSSEGSGSRSCRGRRPS